MKQLAVACLSLAFISSGLADEAETPDVPEPKGDVHVLSVFPPLAPGQTIYVVQENEASGRTIDTLEIPDGVTLTLAPGLPGIDWTVREIRFGKGATIDLSAPPDAPAKAANGAPPPPQPGYCKRIFSPGDSGKPGASSVAGRSLTLRSIRKIVLKGSLWIKTDGGPGGAGGDGGQGQQGGGPRKTVLNPCDAADGGAGGAGGRGGAGGDTSPILLTFMGRAPDINSGMATDCGPSTRPNGTSGDTGVISIWGGGGCGGAGGAAGPGGLSGGEGAHNGPPGPGGSVGPNGNLSQVQIVENE